MLVIRYVDEQEKIAKCRVALLNYNYLYVSVDGGAASEKQQL